MVAALLLVYGFPYMLAIPSVWDIALRSTIEKMQELKLPKSQKGHQIEDLKADIEVIKPEAIEKAASLDYICLQTINVLDKKGEADLDSYRESIECL